MTTASIRVLAVTAATLVFVTSATEALLKCSAARAADPVVLTNSEEIDILKRRLSAAAARDQSLQRRLNVLEEAKTTKEKEDKALSYRVVELERIAHGLQKQVTILYSKRPISNGS